MALRQEQSFVEARAALAECLFTPEAWPAALRALGDVVGAHSGCVSLPVYDAATGFVLDGIGWNMDVAAAADFAFASGEIDPWSKAVVAKGLHRPGSAFIGADLGISEMTDASPWWDGFYREVDNGDLLAVLSKPVPGFGAPVASLALQRGRRDRPFEKQHIEALKPLFADMERALQVSFVLRQAARSMGVARRMINDLAEAVIVVGAHGRVLDHNPAAELLFQRGDPWRSVLGRLVGRTDGDSAALKIAIERAIGAGIGADLTCTTAQGQRLVTSIAPMAPGQAPQWASSAAALVIVRSDAATAALRMAMLRDTFGFTGAEAEIALYLAQGNTVAQISKLRGVSRETTRPQLRALFLKLGVRSQVEAVALINSCL